MSRAVAEVAAALLGELPDPVVIVDPAGAVRWSNRSADAAAGAGRIPPDLAEPAGNLAARARNAPGAVQVVVIVGPGDGRTELWAVARGPLVALRWRGIGQRDRTAADPKRANIKLGLLLDMIPAAVWVAHDDQATQLTVNRQGAEWLRLRRRANASLSAPGPERPCHFRVERDGVELSPEQLPMQRAARGEVVTSEELRIVFDNGDHYDELFSARPLRDRDNRLIGAVGAAIDITSRRRVEEALQRSEQRFRDFALSASDWMWETDAAHRFVWMSLNVEKLTGVPAAWHYGKTRLELMAPTTDPAVLAEHQGVLDRREPFRDLEFLRRGPNGDTWLSTSGVPVYDGLGRFLGYRGTARVITARKAVEARIRGLVQQDSLTGLGNRRLLFERLEPAVALARREQRHGALLLLDLDEFKAVNDRLGHSAGDELLVQIGRRVAAVLRQSDTQVRLGGDEFAILQPECSQPDGAVALAERIVAAFSEPFSLTREAVRISCSLGIALFPDDGRSADALLRHADLALYRAKAEGGDRYRLFEAAMDQAVRRRRRVARDIQDALRSGNIHLMLAPVRDLRTGRVVAAEVGLRWQQPDGRQADVGRSLDAAAPPTLLAALDAWTLAQAWSLQTDAGPGSCGCPLVVPLRTQRLGGTSLVELVRAKLAMVPRPAAAIELAVPSPAVWHPEIDPVLAELVGLGVALSLYSRDSELGCSVARLAALPVRRLVLDLAPVGADADRQVLGASLRAAQAAASALGRAIAARGVSRIGDERLLRTLGYETVQGPVAGTPRAPAGFVELLRHSLIAR